MVSKCQVLFLCRQRYHPYRESNPREIFSHEEDSRRRKIHTSEIWKERRLWPRPVLWAALRLRLKCASRCSLCCRLPSGESEKRRPHCLHCEGRREYSSVLMAGSILRAMVRNGVNVDSEQCNTPENFHTRQLRLLRQDGTAIIPPRCILSRVSYMRCWCCYWFASGWWGSVTHFGDDTCTDQTADDAA